MLQFAKSHKKTTIGVTAALAWIALNLTIFVNDKGWRGLKHLGKNGNRPGKGFWKRQDAIYNSIPNRQK